MGIFGRTRRAAEAATCSGDAGTRAADPAAAASDSPGERGGWGAGGRWIALVPGTRLGSPAVGGRSARGSMSAVVGSASASPGWGVQGARKPRRTCAGVNPFVPGTRRGSGPDCLSGGGGRLSSAMLRPPGPQAPRSGHQRNTASRAVQPESAIKRGPRGILCVDLVLRCPGQRQVTLPGTGRGRCRTCRWLAQASRA
jgi:hypothetical protein